MNLELTIEEIELLQQGLTNLKHQVRTISALSNKDMTDELVRIQNLASYISDKKRKVVNKTKYPIAV